jgi:RNA polymerase sigma-70 factor (ECF subfamily)
VDLRVVSTEERRELPPQKRHEDRDLVAAMQAGDQAMARAFHDRIRPQVDAVTFRLLGGGDVERDDVAQIALVEIITTIDQYRGACSLDSWVSIVSARVVYRHLRRRRLERRVFGGLGDIDSIAKPTVQPVVLRSLISRVVGFLEKMDERRSWAFVLHDTCGYDLREMAEILGISVAAAQARLVRGRAELHARIAADPELAEILGKWEASE